MFCIDRMSKTSSIVLERERTMPFQIFLLKKISLEYSFTSTISYTSTINARISTF